MTDCHDGLRFEVDDAVQVPFVLTVLGPRRLRDESNSPCDLDGGVKLISPWGRQISQLHGACWAVYDCRGPPMSAAHFVEAGDKLAAKHRRERLHRKGEAAAGVNRPDRIVVGCDRPGSRGSNVTCVRSLPSTNRPTRRLG